MMADEAQSDLVTGGFLNDCTAISSSPNDVDDIPITTTAK